MIAAIAGFFTALPEMLKLIQSLMGWINEVSGNDPKGFVKRVGVVFDTLAAAKTVEERQNAAKDIAQLISGL